MLLMTDGVKLMPCGKKDCTECEVCKYDLPLDIPLKQIRENVMTKLVPLNNNPATSQIILAGHRDMKPIDGHVQLALPLKDDSKASLYCNSCEYFLKNGRTNKYTTRCLAETPRPGGAYRVVKLNVYEDEKVKKPFWCPLIKKEITSSLLKPHKFSGLITGQNKSALSDSQLKEWERIRNEKRLRDIWLGMGGITSWSEIKIGELYHLPPTLKKNRMDIRIKTKYCSSIEAINIKTNERLWLYKQDEEYKFLSKINE